MVCTRGDWLEFLWNRERQIRRQASTIGEQLWISISARTRMEMGWITTEYALSTYFPLLVNQDEESLIGECT